MSGGRLHAICGIQELFLYSKSGLISPRHSELYAKMLSKGVPGMRTMFTFYWSTVYSKYTLKKDGPVETDEGMR